MVQQLPPELWRTVLAFAFPPPCQVCPLPICRDWLPSPCRGERPQGCPMAAPLCCRHQQRELTVWREVWQESHRQHANPFRIHSPYLDALKGLQQHMSLHLLFEVVAEVIHPPPHEAWIWIAPGHWADAWWQAFCLWAGRAPDDGA